MSNVTGQRGIYTLTDSLVVPAPLREVFDFFDRAENLETITPDSIRFELLTPTPVPMHAGQAIDYRVRVRGVPVRWTSLIAEYDPPHRFVDIQLRGPYAFWHHTHTFEQTADGTRITDRVVYAPPFGPLGRLLNAAFIQRDVTGIFTHRRGTIQQRFGRQRNAA